MRVLVTAVLLCVLLEACGSKGGLTLPPKPGSEPQQTQSNSNKQN
jgi:predicted small lipoprotein YifL